MTATVMIPTTGATEVRNAIESVLNQTYDTLCYVVCDGNKFKSKTKVILDDYLGNKNLRICYLPENVGANGFYGHRVYAAFTHLVNTEYVMYLDQDNWLQPNHVQSCVDTINDKKLQWCHSLRNIYGKWMAWTNTYHIDTNTYFLKREIAIKLASAWHGGWGQDRVFLQVINQYFPQTYSCTGEYTVNYRVDGGEGSVNKEFFIKGNEFMNDKYDGEFPWKKKI